ncbi:MAG: aminopeptidase N [Azovibrio sp.]
MSSTKPQAILLKNYTPPAFLVQQLALDVSFEEDSEGKTGETLAIVSARMELVRNPQAPLHFPLELDGEELETLSISINGTPCTTYQEKPGSLVLENPPERFILETRVRIHPDKNTHLSGLYKSKDGYFTQCEAQGFRHITWFPDRPDVMTTYTVTLHADEQKYPMLLSNGNLVASGKEEGGRHWATWEDPFKKPCYLFALVAAKLDVIQDSFTTLSGRKVKLGVYVEPGKLDQSQHTLEALKKAMAWDEQRFGLECDLDHYMIVAVGDFNMGAMENKGLNIFNTKYVLAKPDVATDLDFENIDRVVAHEYFHNWTGNRVTCREWFQLSLKEGLTVFRDQEFGADHHGENVARIREVRQLRAIQFPEDAGPMAHPIRPEEYLEINNFYTATVYEKGAEVIRMIQTLIGRENFRKGMDLYFARHDGQAVTCENFVAAMGDASGFNFSTFKPWYSQAGTPRVEAHGHYDVIKQRYTLNLRQSCPATPGQPEKWLVLIPVAVGLVSPEGKDIDLGNGEYTRILHLTQPEQEFVFEGISSYPTPSLLRNFSAPVILDYTYTDESLAHLLAHDSDPFNRWEAGQRLFSRLILAGVKELAEGRTPTWSSSVLEAARQVLTHPQADPSFIAEALTLPSEATLAEQIPSPVDPEALHKARTGLALYLAEGLEAEFSQLYQSLIPETPYQFNPRQVSLRRLRNLCLGYLGELNTPAHQNTVLAQFNQADNMTDQFAALAVLVNLQGQDQSARKQALEQFYSRWQHEALVVDKWLAVQASSRREDTLTQVETLMQHPAFDLKNPNKVYALLRTFGANHRHFHAQDGSGYRFLAECISRLDPLNPQVASRLARCFDRWKNFDLVRQSHARTALKKLQEHTDLSRDVSDILERTLR